MAGHQTMGGVAVAMLLVALGEHVLLVRREHRKLADFGEIVRQTGFAGGDRGQTACGP